MSFLPLRGSAFLVLLIIGALVGMMLVLGPKPGLKNIVYIDPHMLSAAAADALPQSGVSKPSLCPSFARTLLRGSSDGSGSDVSNLQKFLLQFSGVYPGGTVTGFFGPATEAALGRFQAEKGVVKQGEAGYGTLGPKTRASIDKLCGRKTASLPAV